MAQSSSVQLKQGKRYQGDVTLRGLQVMGSNNQVADKFKELGFTDVACSGSGSLRIAKGTWSQRDQAIALPDQVSNVREIKPIPSLV